MSTEQERRVHRTRERNKFEKWMRRKWGGITLDVLTLGRSEFEYKDTSAQTAWEVWQKFNQPTGE